MSEEIENDASAQSEAVPARKRSRRVTAETPAQAEAVSAADHASSGETGLDLGNDAGEKPKTVRGRGRSKKTDAGDESGESASTAPADESTGDSTPSEPGGDESASGERQGRNRNRNRNRTGNGSAADGEADADNASGDRQGRNRQRDRRRGRGQNDDIEPEILEDDVLLPIGGILDVLDNYAFVRTSGYLPGPQDVYVSLGQVKKYNLRKGDAIIGSIKQPREGDNGGRQKFNALVRIDSINGQTVEEAATRPDFATLTPLYPQERLRLETSRENLTTRVIDVVAPVGKGERGLILSPPKSGKSTVLREIAAAVSENNPEAHLMMVLVDERPEEVTDMERTVRGEVIASTFDRPAEDHTMIAELAIERAKRLVELGQDVVVLLDSLTRLGRAYTLSGASHSRGVPSGTDAQALYPAKKFFGAARKIENGGSLTIIATAKTDGGSQVDDVILEEFAGTANMEVRLSRSLAEQRIFPAVDIAASGTRREDLLMSADEVAVTWKMRRALGDLDPRDALEVVLNALRETSSNVEFLAVMQRTDRFEAPSGIGR